LNKNGLVDEWIGGARDFHAYNARIFDSILMRFSRHFKGWNFANISKTPLPRGPTVAVIRFAFDQKRNFFVVSI
jgi:hypothetical protein